MKKSLFTIFLCLIYSGCGPTDDPDPEVPQEDLCKDNCKELEKQGYPYSKCIAECKP